MSNAIQIYDNGGFEVIQRTASALAASGYFSDAQTQAKAIVKVMAGAELGIAPFAAMTGIHVIKGKVSVGGALLAGIIKNDPRYDFRVLVMDDKEVSLQFYESGHNGQWEKSGISTFTAADAKRAGTQNMGKFPRNMLFNRAISNGAKWYAPGAGGGMPVYTDGEIVSTSTPSPAASVNFETGEIIDEQPIYEADEPPFVEDEPTPPMVESRDGDAVINYLIQQASGKTNPASEGSLKYMRSSLKKVAKNADAKILLKVVYGLESSADATQGQASAIIDWIGSSAPDWEPSPVAVTEAAAVLSGEIAQAMK